MAWTVGIGQILGVAMFCFEPIHVLYCYLDALGWTCNSSPQQKYPKPYSIPYPKPHRNSLSAPIVHTGVPSVYSFFGPGFTAGAATADCLVTSVRSSELLRGCNHHLFMWYRRRSCAVNSKECRAIQDGHRTPSIPQTSRLK